MDLNVVDEAMNGSISAVPLRLMSWRLSWARPAGHADGQQTDNKGDLLHSVLNLTNCTTVRQAKPVSISGTDPVHRLESAAPLSAL